ncbi:hypothetical protein N7326_02715 [Corynebacterium sp. ES2794-CONJ1]|uniref:hypothetical protein n=1 Tax=unclassified Corynebacterium TaxID=2624378 RepID=UPI0021680097|nr:MULTISPECIES: hypothetical protein [unclassified Corynebacterium]MCS4489487.1 hypothetical protein [Corynebacterium sp. ES2775-CONJ]MCS4491502.1 hypothetical protein [Corynebacterium sp. ES2715-CONJ3]MCS4531398.1 hypothetical protein [Corynebacterium sp. ES2730-CONJ]MCU9518785.1 hypothetical protein [Corynebacterium sp. ES2794-CONJ1]
MHAWDHEIFNEEVVTSFLDELAMLDESEIASNIHDAILLGLDDQGSDDEFIIGLAAATIVAIWASAPYTDGEVVEHYPFIRELIGHGDEELRESASSILELAETDLDLDVYTEALT